MSEAPVEEEVDYVAIARSIVRRLTGGRWNWPPVEVRDMFTVPAGTRILQLRGEPILEVVSVTDHDSGEELEFGRLGSGRIELARSACRPRRRYDVIYQFGARPSALVLRAIAVLAHEMQLADADDAKCRIPSRVTSVTRQGLSWSRVDPMDFIDKGRTGIVEIDMAINAVNPTSARRRPRVFSTEFPPPDRLYARVLPDPDVDPTDPVPGPGGHFTISGGTP